MLSALTSLVKLRFSPNSGHTIETIDSYLSNRISSHEQIVAPAFCAVWIATVLLFMLAHTRTQNGQELLCFSSIIHTTIFYKEHCFVGCPARIYVSSYKGPSFIFFVVYIKKNKKNNKQYKIATDNNMFALADQPPLVCSQLGCRQGMPHILTQEAAKDTFWLMESFMGGMAHACLRAHLCVKGTSALPCWGLLERTRRQATLQGVITSSTIRNTITSVLSRRREREGAKERGSKVLRDSVSVRLYKRGPPFQVIKK